MDKKSCQKKFQGSFSIQPIILFVFVLTVLLSCRCLQPTNLFYLFNFFLADLSYVGFVPLGDFVDINGDK